MSCEAKHICLNSSCHFQAVLDGSGGNRPGQVGTIWKAHFQVQAKRYTSLLFWNHYVGVLEYNWTIGIIKHDPWNGADVSRVICSNYFKHQPSENLSSSTHQNAAYPAAQKSYWLFVDDISTTCFWFLLNSAAGQINVWNIVVCKT